MKISFVIPAHNEEEKIGQCLSSIVNQLRDKPYDGEIIVVNNASTDRTGEIAREYPGVLVVDEPKKGLVIARNAGFNNASGEIVANIDADTMLTPGWIEKVLRAFEKDPKLVCLSGPFVYYDLPSWVRFCQKIFYAFGFLIYLANRFVLQVSSMVQGGNFVLKKAALEEVGGFDVAIEFYGEDTDIARRLNRVGRVRFTFGLPILASGRRLIREGIFRTAGVYVVTYLRVSLFGKAPSRKSTDVRTMEKDRIGV